MCDNCGKANSFPIQYAPARHMIVQSFVDIDLFTGTLEAGEHKSKMCSVVSPTVNATPSKVPSSVTDVLNKL
jgi:hypothetical protein